MHDVALDPGGRGGAGRHLAGRDAVGPLGEIRERVLRIELADSCEL